MATVEFSDGTRFDTSGCARVELRHDGWYVLGSRRPAKILSLEIPVG